MHDFGLILEPSDIDGYGVNPFAARDADGDWHTGRTSIQYLNSEFGGYETAQQMIDATDDPGFKALFAWLRDEGKLP